MNIHLVRHNKDRKDFVEAAYNIYKDDPNWIPILDQNIHQTFSPDQNPYYSHGIAERWILKDKNQNLIGRIAAFINYNKWEKDGKKVGGIGFFDCIDNQEAADLMFNEASQWLASQKADTIEGPINFGENNEYWGLLVEGFSEPTYGMNYHLPYYQRLFEDYGFEKKYEQYTNELDLTSPFPARFEKIALWIERKPNYSIKKLDTSKLEIFAKDFVFIYNQAWKDHQDFNELKEEDILKAFVKMKSAIDVNLILFAYDNDQPIGFFVGIPDLNQIFKRFNGKLNIINKLRFVYLKNKRVIDRVKIMIMGIIPDYQEKGIDAALIMNAVKSAQANGQYKKVELSWVGDFNPKMISLHEATGAVRNRTHITYQKHIA